MLDIVMNWVLSTGIKVVIALVILIISFAIINSVCGKLQRSLEAKEKLDKTLTRTLGYAAKLALKGLVLICLIGYLGIETSGLSAVIASLGVTAGLAVNGTLSNLAGGIMLLITRPFSVGDYIEAQGMQGSVQDIRICNTKIVTLDNKVVYLPNSALSTGTITNYSEADNRRVDLDFSVAGNDPKLVSDTLLGLAKANALVLADPLPFARITDFGAGNGTKISLRVWCKSADYWTVYSDLLEAAEKAFAEKNIVVPFNQLDVHLDQKN
ncbi:MAG: mechanosensitive ion channel family protein [Eubacteriales bacterium]|nr:mechanosensitive ion channel family protein [Eubacteriales bacterium]